LPDAIRVFDEQRLHSDERRGSPLSGRADLVAAPEIRTVPAAADHRLAPPGDRSCARGTLRITVWPQPTARISVDDH
jgi:hypothetical protein